MSVKEKLKTKAIERMEEFDLIEKGWYFEWSKKKRSLGDCNHTKKRIRLSEYFAALISFDDMVDTINHEIAHAIVESGNGHNQIWKEACIKTGANPERVANKVIIGNRTFKWTGTCPSCGHESNRHRLTNSSRDSSCGKCAKKYDPNFIFEWKQNF